MKKSMLFSLTALLATQAPLALNAMDAGSSQNPEPNFHVENYANMSPANKKLVDSFFEKNVAVLEQALSVGGNVNLHLGFDNGHFDQQCYDGLFETKIDHDGRTLLHIASGNEKLHELINKLIESGADPNARDNHGNTPLHEAVQQWILTLFENSQAICALVNAGSNIDGENYSGQTPLESGIALLLRISGSNVPPTKTLQALLNLGANIHTEKLPIMASMLYSHPAHTEIRKLLQTRYLKDRQTILAQVVARAIWGNSTLTPNLGKIVAQFLVGAKLLPEEIVTRRWEKTMKILLASQREFDKFIYH